MSEILLNRRKWQEVVMEIPNKVRVNVNPTAEHEAIISEPTENAKEKKDAFYKKMWKLTCEIKHSYPNVFFRASCLMLTVSNYSSLEEMNLLNKEQFLKKNWVLDEKTYDFFVLILRQKGYLH